MATAAELQREWRTEAGQLWAIGPHRLLIGEALDRASYSRLLRGASPVAVVTDPPYSILGGGTSIAGQGVRAPFDRQFFRAWFQTLMNTADHFLAPVCAWWMTIDWRGAVSVEEALYKLDSERWRFSGLGIWNRGGLGMGYALRHAHEHFCLLTTEGWERTKTDEPDVWSIPWSPAERITGHQAQKPVELMRRGLELCGGSGPVLDPFVGSGATILACRELGRTCYAIDSDPQYAAVLLDSLLWQGLPGVLVEGE